MKSSPLSISKVKQLRNLAITSFKRPSAIAFELTNRCNANCAMCPRESVKRKRQDMSFADFQHGVDTAVEAGVKAFQLSFFGESLLYSRLEDAVRYIKEKDPEAVCVMNTNASLLNREKAKALLDAGMNSFRISIEGNTPEEYDEIRMGMSFERLEQNVKDLRRLIDEGEYSCNIVIQGLHIQGHSILERPYLERWSQWADHVGVRNDHTTNGMVREAWWHKFAPCPAILGQVIVLVDGRTTICAYDWAGEKAHNSVRKTSIKDIWHSRYLWSLRLMHLMGMKKLLPYCRSCNYRMGSLGV